MKFSIYLRLSIILVIFFTFTSTYAQTNSDKIKAKWVVEKFDIEKNTPQAIQAKQELLGLCLNFENEELIIARRTEKGDSIIKKGPYLISGNTLTLGKGPAAIYTLTEKELVIQIPRQGVLYLTKL
jgi:hypothetical protein